ncbi:D-alanyl-D-alanine carboxypeptidase A [Bartonella choladocola]|uniref:D-alanyl-D-alanine carboxypeptidase family protein n=1 Tax=Bartonella TaxID=773 RepID=UPI0018DD0D3E|nr:D-alanyl-D-alanine carboxypeptidase family protein [Bartonella choladocola]MBI0140636.1 D-alanyl-D-alanine carboxypeptidase [Bartonella choladocola]
MRAVIIYLFGSFLFGSIATQSFAQNFQITATQAIMVDGETGSILYQKSPRTRFEPASLAKLMTAEVVFHLLESGALREDQLFHISVNAWRTGGAPSRTNTMFAPVNSDISVLDLLRGMIIVNGNDAAIALAEGISGSEEKFADLMNERAKELGLNSSHFVNATGLPENGQYTNVSDVIRLSRHIAHSYPKYFKIYSEPEISWSKITQRNKNPLFALNIGAEGFANAFSESSGFSTSAVIQNNNRQLFLVLNGIKKEKDRPAEAAKLFNWGMTAFEFKQVFPKDVIVGYAHVFGGKKPLVPLLVKEPVDILMNVEKKSVISAKIIYHGPLDAPVKADVEVGKLQILADKTVLLEKPVFTADEVAETGLVGKAKDALYELTLGWLRKYL